jgi:hypothetical protein
MLFAATWFAVAPAPMESAFPSFFIRRLLSGFRARGFRFQAV